jgi:hypothetical protein
VAVARILGDGTRQRTQVFSELQSHYLFEDRFECDGADDVVHRREALSEEALDQLLPLPWCGEPRTVKWNVAPGASQSLLQLALWAWSNRNIGHQLSA